MLVTRNLFQKSVEELSNTVVAGLDTESTGLSWKDRLFCVTIVTAFDKRYTFDFRVLPIEWLIQLKPVFDNPDSFWFITNAKHDMRMLWKEGLEIKGIIADNMVWERLIKNNHMGKKPYSLEAMAPRYGFQKDGAVDSYILENGLYDKVQIPGKKKAVLLKHFDQVPLEIMQPYAEKDSELHLKIGLQQEIELYSKTFEDRRLGVPELGVVASTESRLIKVCFQMEINGMALDQEYTRKAMEYEQAEVKRAKEAFEAETKIPFSDGRGCLVKAFMALNEPYPTTEKGNPSFTAEVLENMTTPVAALVNKIRHHEKRLNTYYSSFIYFVGRDGLIHPNMKQSGTETGRMSYSDPNLQNVPKEDDEEDRSTPYHVRKCFVPKYAGHPLVMIDWNQQEFRMMLDYAGQMDLIAAINDGHDPHQATSDMVGIPRRAAKILNFGILYGMGKDKMAKAMGCSVREAEAYREKWFGRMPNVKRFIRDVQSVGRQRGYIRNWAGRRCYLNDDEYAYILPNHLIQGGGADIIKRAMVQIDEYFREKKMRTEMNLQVHDELVFNWHPNEYEEIAKIQQLMEAVYTPRNGMNLTCSVDHSFISWGHFDKQKGVPCSVLSA